VKPIHVHVSVNDLDAKFGFTRRFSERADCAQAGLCKMDDGISRVNSRFEAGDQTPVSIILVYKVESEDGVDRAPWPRGRC